MGGPRIDISKVNQTIQAQPRPFTYEDIARECRISVASILRIIKDLEANGEIIVDHKVGKRKFYAIANKNGKVARTTMAILPPKERFAHIGAIVDMVTDGIAPSVLITGTSGIGKTYLVRQRMLDNGLKENTDFLTVTAHSTPMGLYTLLHDHQEQCIVFDDCDAVFSEESSVNILKAALDSYSERKVCWNSTRMPEGYESSFLFKGKIIFISNRMASSIDEAVKSRTLVVDLQMSRAEICDYLRTILSAIQPFDLDLATKQAILNHLASMSDAFTRFDIRTFISACRIYQGAKKQGKDWTKMLHTVM